MRAEDGPERPLRAEDGPERPLRAEDGPERPLRAEDGPERPLRAEDVAHYPLPGTVVPGSIAFAPDDSCVTWLHSVDGTLRRELFAVEVVTGERSLLIGADSGVSEAGLSIEEKLRRERARELNVGVTAYAWAKNADAEPFGDTFLVPLPDGLHIGRWSKRDAGLTLVAPVGDGGAILDPRLSLDGGHVAYVQNAELYVVPTDGAWPPHQVTSGARGTGRTHGLADFIAQEEMGQQHGFWWSPDSARLAFLEVDETDIPVYRIQHADGTYEDHRYPFAGAANPKVRLGVVLAHQQSSSVHWLDLGAFEYLARVDWLDADHLVVQLEDRVQSRLDVVLVDVRAGHRRVLLSETSDVWINLHHVFRPMREGTGFLWASERSGFLHLEVRSAANGALIRVLTEGEWCVTAVKAVSDTHVWFLGTKDSPLERHLYVVAFETGEVRRITRERGTHDVEIDHARARFVDTWSALGQPPVVRLCSLVDGSVETVLFGERDPRVDEIRLEPPELTTVLAADGVTPVHVAMYRPASADGPFPTVVSVYGGPHAQRVTDSWLPTVRMRDQYLRSLGYLVVAVDNRGSANRGLAFEGALRHDLGSVEVDDQVAALRQLADRGLVDVQRGVAIHGWSYGGYMSAMCLAKAPDVFRVAVAGAPVTHWDGYDTHYTERYMGLPDANHAGYERSSVMAHVDGMRERHLMLVHGMIDENVHFRHTARLINALIKARVPYQLLLFPDERHLPRSEADRVFMEEQIRAFVSQHLPVGASADDAR